MKNWQIFFTLVVILKNPSARGCLKHDGLPMEYSDNIPNFWKYSEFEKIFRVYENIRNFRKYSKFSKNVQNFENIQKKSYFILIIFKFKNIPIFATSGILWNIQNVENIQNFENMQHFEKKNIRKEIFRFFENIRKTIFRFLKIFRFQNIPANFVILNATLSQ